MSKRDSGAYPRIPRDLYPTPFKSVPPLIKYLRRDGIKTFAEPCCGDGDLIRHLESFGFRCVYSGDIATGQDALGLTIADLNGAQVGITNPAFKYPPGGPKDKTRLMRDLLQHFLDIGLPCWWLLPHDFANNENAEPFLPYCSDIVAAPRAKWIKDSKYGSGFDNSDWYRLDPQHRGDTAFRNDRGRQEEAAE